MLQYHFTFLSIFCKLIFHFIHFISQYRKQINKTLFGGNLYDGKCGLF